MEIDIDQIAEEAALKASDGYCLKNNHAHDCCCSMFEEGFKEGYSYKASFSDEKLKQVIEFIKEMQSFMNMVPNKKYGNNYEILHRVGTWMRNNNLNS